MRAIQINTSAIQCLLFLRVFGLHGFGFAHLRKIINIKKSVRFTTRNQIYAIFGLFKRKLFDLQTQKSVIHDFRVLSSEIVKLFSFYTILGLHGCFQESNPVYN